jgi:hypothetical protein
VRKWGSSLAFVPSSQQQRKWLGSNLALLTIANKIETRVLARLLRDPQEHTVRPPAAMRQYTTVEVAKAARERWAKIKKG